jgi:glycosyltransferase involved in cell wall biosynthesis
MSGGKIAMYYPCFTGGGAEAVALWMLQSLKDRYHLTLVTLTDLDWSILNAMYGTTLDNQSVQVDPVFPQSFNQFLNQSFNQWVNFLYANNKELRSFFIHWVLRYFKKKMNQYDLVISGYNAADLGKPGLQYIHWIKVLEGGAKSQKYYQLISQFSLDNLKQNISLANSKLVAKAAAEHYGVNPIVVYPPVVIEPSHIPWAEKENTFICSGRLTAAKQPHRVIECLAQVRSQGFPVKLYITGGGGGVGERKYQRYLNELITQHQDWVKLFENLTYAEYSQLLYRCQYGIHFKPEPFGISVAEMVKAGQIPFVRSGWGPMEILGEQNTDLFFSDFEEAVTKIVAVLGNPEKQAALLLALEQQKQLFSTERFMKDIRGVVDEYFEQSNRFNQSPVPNDADKSSTGLG